jgi:hypothetical protein
MAFYASASRGFLNLWQRQLMMPERIQRKRTKGYRMPPNTVSVARPGKWGNPFTIAAYYDAGYSGPARVAAQHCVDAYKAWMLGNKHWAHPCCLEDAPDPSRELRGKNLACFCPLDQPCHANVLLELANR